MRWNTFGSLRTAFTSKDHPVLWKEQRRRSSCELSGADLINDGLQIACWHGARSWNESPQPHLLSHTQKSGLYKFML